MAVLTPVGTFTDYDGFVALLRARKEQLGLSDMALDHLAGLAHGHTGKLLGPAQERRLGVSTFGVLLNALGLSGTLYVDPAKAAALADRMTPRRSASVHPNGRISRAMVKRARATVLHELARKAVKARWAKSTPEARATTVAALNAARAAKRKLRTRTKKVA
jgi:hypothetical protein